MSKKKKPRRVVLGVGHPWFEWIRDGNGGMKLALFPKDPSQVGCHRKNFKIGELGAYNRIRLIAEIIK